MRNLRPIGLEMASLPMNRPARTVSNRPVMVVAIVPAWNGHTQPGVIEAMSPSSSTRALSCRSRIQPSNLVISARSARPVGSPVAWQTRANEPKTAKLAADRGLSQAKTARTNPFTSHLGQVARFRRRNRGLRGPKSQNEPKPTSRSARLLLPRSPRHRIMQNEPNARRASSRCARDSLHSLATEPAA